MSTELKFKYYDKSVCPCCNNETEIKVEDYTHKDITREIYCDNCKNKYTYFFRTYLVEEYVINR